MGPATKSMVYFGLIGLLIAGSMIAVFQVRPILSKDGTVSVYMSSIQSDISGDPNLTNIPSQSATAHTSGKPTANILSLNVTIDSVTIHKSGEANDSGWMEVSRTTFTFDILKLFNVSKLIATARVAEENITMVRLHVASATAAVNIQGSINSKPVNVTSNDLRIPVSPAVRVRAQLSSSIVISGMAHIVIEGNGKIMLTPVLHVEKTTGPRFAISGLLLKIGSGGWTFGSHRGPFRTTA